MMRFEYGSPGFSRAPSIPARARRNRRKSRGNLARHVLMYDPPTKELPTGANRDQLRKLEGANARILHLCETQSLAGDDSSWHLAPGLRGDDRADPNRSLRLPIAVGKTRRHWQDCRARASCAEFAAHRSVCAPSCLRQWWPPRAIRAAGAPRPGAVSTSLSHPVGPRRLDDPRSTGRSRTGDLLWCRSRTRRRSGGPVAAPNRYARRSRSAGRNDSRPRGMMAPLCAFLAKRHRAMPRPTESRSGWRARGARLEAGPDSGASVRGAHARAGPSRRRQTEETLIVSTHVSHL
jgi:hypothetical protein